MNGVVVSAMITKMANVVSSSTCTHMCPEDVDRCELVAPGPTTAAGDREGAEVELQGDQEEEEQQAEARHGVQRRGAQRQQDGAAEGAPPAQGRRPQQDATLHEFNTRPRAN